MESHGLPSGRVKGRISEVLCVGCDGWVEILVYELKGFISLIHRGEGEEEKGGFMS